MRTLVKKVISTMRCKHNKQVEVHEEIESAITHLITKGKKSGEIFSAGQGTPTGFINVSCVECRGTWRFNRYVSVRGLCHVPMWVQDVASAASIQFVCREGYNRN